MPMSLNVIELWGGLSFHLLTFKL